jgi:hypothetical protein
VVLTKIFFFLQTCARAFGMKNRDKDFIFGEMIGMLDFIPFFIVSEYLNPTVATDSHILPGLSLG